MTYILYFGLDEVGDSLHDVDERWSIIRTSVPTLQHHFVHLFRTLVRTVVPFAVVDERHEVFGRQAGIWGTTQGEYFPK